MTARRPPTTTPHPWAFKARFRRHAFGWKSAPAIQRIREAVSEIKKVARREPVVGAEGAVLFFERLVPAIEEVDSSSGAIGAAVNGAIEALVPIIAHAPADANTRADWLERLWGAHAEDQITYIDRLAEFWGALCGSKEVASTWADRLLGITRTALGANRVPRGYFHGTTACLSALDRAGRYAEILDVLQNETFWPYRRWAVKALGAMGKEDEAIGLAESSRGPWTNDADVDALCEELLLSADRAEEAYSRYSLGANRRGTYLATFRAIVRKYPAKPPARVLADLVAATPGEEGKWFTAAKDLGLYEAAVELARTSPCDPRTLARAARDHVKGEPSFALEAGYAALTWMVQGFGYELSTSDVRMAFAATMTAGESLGRGPETTARIRSLATSHAGLVADVLRAELGRVH